MASTTEIATGSDVRMLALLTLAAIYAVFDPATMSLRSTSRSAANSQGGRYAEQTVRDTVVVFSQEDQHLKPMELSERRACTVVGAERTIVSSGWQTATTGTLGACLLMSPTVRQKVLWHTDFKSGDIGAIYKVQKTDALPVLLGGKAWRRPTLP